MDQLITFVMIFHLDSTELVPSYLKTCISLFALKQSVRGNWVLIKICMKLKFRNITFSEVFDFHF